MKPWFQTTLVVFCFIGGALALRANEGDKKGGEGKPEQRREMFLKHMKERLELTDAQGQKLSAAFDAREQAEKPLRREVRDATAKLKDQLEDKAAEDALKGTLDRLDKARKDMVAAGEKFHDDLTGVLTITQRAKMAVAMEKHMRGGPMGMHRPGGKMGGPGMEREKGGKPDKDAPGEESEGPEDGD